VEGRLEDGYTVVLEHVEEGRFAGVVLQCGLEGDHSVRANISYKSEK